MKTVFDYQREGEKGKIRRFVLLSTSPRRKELLSFLNPEIQAVEVDERAIEDQCMASIDDQDFLTKAAKICCEISKAKSDLDLEAETLYISADTIVVVDGQIYNKPQDLAEAGQMFRSYFGKSHHVVTSVCLRMQGFLEVFYTVAQVDFVDYKRPLDKAGAYGFQELDPRFIRSITGDMHTIIGLPVAETSYRIFRDSKGKD